MILEELIKKKDALHKQINNSFLAGLKEVVVYPEIQSIVVYKIAQMKDNAADFSYIFAFRPKKENKFLMELAEEFKFNKDLEHACIPLMPEGMLSTTKTYNTERKVKDLIKKYYKLNKQLNDIFNELSEDLDMQISLDDDFNANIFKLT